MRKRPWCVVGIYVGFFEFVIGMLVAVVAIGNVIASANGFQDGMSYHSSLIMLAISIFLVVNGWLILSWQPNGEVIGGEYDVLTSGQIYKVVCQAEKKAIVYEVYGRRHLALNMEYDIRLPDRFLYESRSYGQKFTPTA